MNHKKDFQVERLRKCRVRAADMQRNIGYVAARRPHAAYLIPMVESYDFKNFEIKLAEIVEDDE